MSITPRLRRGVLAHGGDLANDAFVDSAANSECIELTFKAANGQTS